MDLFCSEMTFCCKGGSLGNRFALDWTWGGGGEAPQTRTLPVDSVSSFVCSMNKPVMTCIANPHLAAMWEYSHHYGSTPTKWEYSHIVGVLPHHNEGIFTYSGSTLRMWEFFQHVGVFPHCGSTPTLRKYSLDVGVPPPRGSTSTMCEYSHILGVFIRCGSTPNQTPSQAKRSQPKPS